MNGPLMSGESGAGGGGVDELTRRIEQLRAQIASHREESGKVAREAAEKERIGLIQSEIARRGITGGAAEDALRYFRDETVTEADGSVMSRSGQALGDFVSQVVSGPKKHWRASSAPGAVSTASSTGFDTSVIRPGMTEAEKAAAYAAIGAIVKGRR
jgi:hypothetical protein